MPKGVRRPARSRGLSKNRLQRRIIRGAVPCDLESPGSSYPSEDEDCTLDVINLDTSQHCLPRQDPPPCVDERRVFLNTVCISSVSQGLAHSDLRHCLTTRVVPRESVVTGVVSECNLEKQRYLAGRNKALADMKRVCFDENCYDENCYDDDCPSI